MALADRFEIDKPIGEVGYLKKLVPGSAQKQKNHFLTGVWNFLLRGLASETRIAHEKKVKAYRAERTGYPTAVIPWTKLLPFVHPKME